MRAPTILALGAFSACTANAQSTYTRMYQSAPSYSFNLIELPSHNILSGLAATLLMNPEGYIEHVGWYHSGGTYLTQSLKAAGENVFYFTTGTTAAPCLWPGGALIHPVLGKMDSLGSVLSMRRYELNSGICYGIPGGLEITNDGGAITWGREDLFYALRVDQDFDHMWSKRILRGGGFSFIKELPSGDLLAGINLDTAGAVVARMNANGDFLWTKSYIRPRGVVQDALVVSDDSFIIVGYTDSTESTNPSPPPPVVQPKLFMMNLDGVGAVQWCRGWQSSTDPWITHMDCKVELTLDNRIVVLATLDYRPFLMKTHLNGDTIWTRSVGRPNYGYVTQDLSPHSDGGFMINGIIYGDMPNASSSLMYIYKADSLGHFPCWERMHSIQAFDLFPVDSSFTLTAEDGLATVTPISVMDSIMDPNLFTTYNGCTFTTGIPAMMSRSQIPRVRPNPNTGRFTVEFDDPLMADSHYSVYDAMGKLLLQRAAAHGKKTEEVDLSRYGAGTYLIKFTDQDGVCYEQVVVE